MTESETRRRLNRFYAPEEGLDRRSFLASVGVATVTLSSGCVHSGQNEEPTTFEGEIVVGEGMEVIEGTVRLENGRIESVVEQGVKSDDVIIPSFVNPHTHITDSVAKDGKRARNYSWEELFVDPNLKSQILEKNTSEEKRDAMEHTVGFMRATGTGTFVDFKEEGVEGVEDLEEVDEGTEVDAKTLLTGDHLGEDDDLEDAIRRADGYNAYYPYDESDERARELCDELGKVFALHSGEPSAEDIDASLALEPDYTSHMVHARQEDYEKMASDGIGLAALPRSNLVILGELPPLEQLHDATTVAIGTDNVMLNSPSMLREMEFTSKLFDFTPTEVLQMATINGARLVGEDDEIGSIEEGKRARLTVVDRSKELRNVEDTVAGIVRRATGRDVKRMVLA